MLSMLFLSINVITSSGMFVSDNVILGASPDGLISCDCHGKGVFEIKCGMKYWNEDPKSRNVTDNLDYFCAEGQALNKKQFMTLLNNTTAGQCV